MSDCVYAGGFGEVKGHLMFVEAVCVLTLADGWCVHVCGQWAQLEADCVSATDAEDLEKGILFNKNMHRKNTVCAVFLLHK